MHKLSIIVPYRNRKEHLKVFLPHMKDFLSDIPHSINIIEQFNDKPFNRAKLLNVGFELTKCEHDYFCFHDVDMLPVEKKYCNYNYVDCPTHMATYVEQFNWQLPYLEYFGGVTLIDSLSFIKLNGYSNDYWGWGVEDDDFLKRCKYFNIKTDRRSGKFRSLHHTPNGDTTGGKASENTIKNRTLFAAITPDNYITNGINNLNFCLKEKIKLDDSILLYKVDI